MKFNNKIGVLLALVLGLSGCGNGEGLEVDKIPNESFSGVLELQKGDDDYLGTHLLVTEDGEVVPLRSLDLNLSKKDYLGNEVKVMGFLNDDSVFQVTDLEVLELNGENSDYGRKSVYVNEDLGFEIAYFSGWEVDEESSVISFVNEMGEEISVRQSPFPYTPTTFEDGSVDSALESYLYTVGESFSEDDLVYVGEEGYEAVKLERADEVVYVIYRAGLIYELMAEVNEERSLMIFNEMVSSFTFTTFDLGHEEEELANEGMKELNYELNSVFESLPYEFRGAYPDDWYYSGTRSSEAGVLHQYSFSDEVVAEDNVLITLDILSSTSIPNGERVSSGGKDIVITGGGSEVYTSLGEMGFRLRGDSEYRDLMVAIAASMRELQE